MKGILKGKCSLLFQHRLQALDGRSDRRIDRLEQLSQLLGTQHLRIAHPIFPPKTDPRKKRMIYISFLTGVDSLS